MPLAIRYEHNLCIPTILCDHCGKEIHSAADGNYQWLWSDKPARIYFTHKACCHPFEERHGGYWGAMDLQCLPAYLVNNLGINWNASKRLANHLSRY